MVDVAGSDASGDRDDDGILCPPNPLTALIAAGARKIGITGAPGTGKTSLVQRAEFPPGSDFLVLHTDELLEMDESYIANVLAWMCEHNYVVEGCYLPQLVDAGLQLDFLIWTRGRSRGRSAKARGLGAKVDSWALRYSGKKVEVWNG